MKNFSSQSWIWMKQGRLTISLGLMAIALAACSTAPSSLPSAKPSANSSAKPSAVLPSTAPVQPAQSDPVAAVPSEMSSEMPNQSSESADSSAQAAAQVILDYYSAIARRDYAQAYSQWDREGQASGQSFEQFKQGFIHTASTAVEVGEPNSSNGAAGSVYVEIPVTITAKMTNGVSQQFRGSYVLRRVNDVPGSTPAQRRWHLYSANITS